MPGKRELIANFFKSKKTWAIFMMAFFVGLSIFSLTLSIKIVLAANDNVNEPYCALPIDDCDNWSYYCTDYGFSWTSNGYPSGAGNPSCCGDDSQEV